MKRELKERQQEKTIRHELEEHSRLLQVFSAERILGELSYDEILWYSEQLRFTVDFLEELVTSNVLPSKSISACFSKMKQIIWYFKCEAIHRSRHKVFLLGKKSAFFGELNTDGIRLFFKATHLKNQR